MVAQKLRDFKRSMLNVECEEICEPRCICQSEIDLLQTSHLILQQKE
jgi:hypothetical protein